MDPDSDLYDPIALLTLTAIFTTFWILNVIHFIWLAFYEFWIKGRRPNKFNILLLTIILIQVGSFCVYSVVGRAVYYQGGVAYDILLAEDGSRTRDQIIARFSLLQNLDNGLEVTKITVYMVFLFLRSYGFLMMKPSLHLKLYKIAIALALACYLIALAGTLLVDRSVIDILSPAALGLGLLVVIMDCYLTFQFIDFIRNSSTWKYQNAAALRPIKDVPSHNPIVLKPDSSMAAGLQKANSDNHSKPSPARINSELPRFMIVAKYGAVGTICSLSSFAAFFSLSFVSGPLVFKSIFLVIHILHWITALSLTIMKIRLDQIAEPIVQPKQKDAVSN